MAELAGISVRTFAPLRRDRPARTQRPHHGGLPPLLPRRPATAAAHPVLPGTGFRPRHQRDLLTERITRHQAMVAAIDKELNARKLGLTLTPAERLKCWQCSASTHLMRVMRRVGVAATSSHLTQASRPGQVRAAEPHTVHRTSAAAPARPRPDSRRAPCDCAAHHLSPPTPYPLTATAIQRDRRPDTRHRFVRVWPARHAA